MTHIDALIEQHIIEYESRLKHIDEMLQRAKEAAGPEDEQQEVSDAGLTALERDRQTLSGQLDELKTQPAEYWQKKGFEKAGPLGMWDTVAQKVESLVERLEGKSKP